MLIDVIRDIHKASKDYLMRFDDVLDDSSEAEYLRRSALTELRKAIVRFNEIEVRREPPRHINCHCDLTEGKVNKGGVNEWPPKTPRPEHPPKGQGPQ